MDDAQLDALVADAAPYVTQPRGERPQPPRLRLVALASDAVDLDLYDVIGWPGIMAHDVLGQMRAIGRRPLRVHLNSPGGDVFDGLAIYNALKRHPAPVEVSVEGLAGSIASVIAMAGSSLRMAAASLLMIHEPHAAVIGTAHDMRHMASLLDKTAGLMADLYATRGAERDAVRGWMHAERWFTAREALDAQLIDGIDDASLSDEALSVAASFDLSHFRHAPPMPVAARVPDSLPAPARSLEHARVAALGWKLLVGESARKERAA